MAIILMITICTCIIMIGSIFIVSCFSIFTAKPYAKKNKETDPYLKSLAQIKEYEYMQNVTKFNKD